MAKLNEQDSWLGLHPSSSSLNKSNSELPIPSSPQKIAVIPKKPRIDPFSQQEVQLEGWLEKEGARVHNWKRRWFVLTKTHLSYYISTDCKEKERKGFVKISETAHINKLDTYKNKKNVISLTTTDRIMYLHTTEDRDRDKWFQAIQEILRHLILKHQSQNGLLKNDTFLMESQKWSGAPVLPPKKKDFGLQNGPPPMPPPSTRTNNNGTANKKQHTSFIEELTAANKNGLPFSASMTHLSSPMQGSSESTPQRPERPVSTFNNSASQKSATLPHKPKSIEDNNNNNNNNNNNPVDLSRGSLPNIKETQVGGSRHENQSLKNTSSSMAQISRLAEKKTGYSLEGTLRFLQNNPPPVQGKASTPMPTLNSINTTLRSTLRYFNTLRKLNDSIRGAKSYILKPPRINVKAALLNGQAKQLLTEWWLARITQEVSTFLSTLGFDFDATPDDYLDTPPKSMQTVISNMELIRKIMDRNIDHFNTQVILYDTLTKEVYQEIIKFEEFAEKIILEVTPYDKAFDLGSFSRYWENEKENMTDTVLVNQVTELIKDLHYLKKIRTLEFHYWDDKSFHSSGEKTGIADTIPISGLILSVFHRLLNELDTVVVHWQSRAKRGK